MDCSDWAVNLCDTAAFSAANDSLQKTDQSWSTCHMSQRHAAAPPTYTNLLRGCRWSEDAAGSGVEIWWGVGEGRGGVAPATQILIDHSQKHGRLEMRGQAHKPRDADRSLRIWRRAISCQSLKTHRFLTCALLPGARTAAPQLLLPSQHLKGEKFSDGST